MHKRKKTTKRKKNKRKKETKEEKFPRIPKIRQKYSIDYRLNKQEDREIHRVMIERTMKFLMYEVYLKNCSTGIAENESHSDSTTSEDNAFKEQHRKEF